MGDRREYYDVFLKRCNGNGASEAQRVVDQIKWNFDNLLKISPNTVEIIRSSQKEPIKAVLISQKDTDTVFQKYLLTRIDSPMNIGELFFWKNTVWLIMRLEETAVEGYNKYLALQCRHKISWINSNGIKNESHCFLVGQTDSKLKESFRSFNTTLAIQTKAPLEIIMPFKSFAKDQRLMFMDTAWQTVNTDYISVNGIIYISLEETKKNPAYDEPNLNDVNLLDGTYIEVEDNIEIGILDSFTIRPQLFINNVSVDAKFSYSEYDEKTIKIDGDIISPISIGETSVAITSSENISKKIKIVVHQEHDLNKYIKYTGKNIIKPGYVENYIFTYYENGVEIDADISIECVDIDGLVSSSINGNEIILKGKDVNKVGKVILKATYDNVVREQTIQFKSLWG